MLFYGYKIAELLETKNRHYPAAAKKTDTPRKMSKKQTFYGKCLKQRVRYEVVKLRGREYAEP
jgi:hypothetical protein